MKAVWLSSTYYLDDAVGQLSGNAERMLTRALAYCGNAETSGFVSENAINLLGLPRPKRLAQELVDANIFVPRPGGGWDFRTWESWNSAGDALIARRKADRDRQARHRAEQRKSREQSREMSRDVTAPEKSREEENTTYVGTDDLRNERGHEADAVEAPAHIETTSTRTPAQPTSATRTVVRQVLGNAGYPRTTVDRLAVQVGKLAREGHPDKLIREALAEWDRRDNCTKPEFLPTVLADIVKASRAQPGNNGKPVHKMRGLAQLAQQVRADEQAAAAQVETNTTRRELTS